jgi:site-specific recombinase XerD
MIPNDNSAISPLRQRMIEDMTARRLAEATQVAHLRAVTLLAKYLKKKPLDSVDAEDLRRFQVHLSEIGKTPSAINATAYGVRFFLDATLDRPDLARRVRIVRVEHRIPVILSTDEVAMLIESASSLKFKTALSVAYGAGLRAGEVCGLRTTDIDSERMILRVDQGKGNKDRNAVLPPLLLERLRIWWRYAKARGMVINGGWVFPGREPINPISTRQLNRAVHAAATVAGIGKPVSMHTLRHCFATHLLEQKVDVRVIQVLLGHKKLSTTATYTQVASTLLHKVISPIESHRTT